MRTLNLTMSGWTNEHVRGMDPGLSIAGGPAPRGRGGGGTESLRCEFAQKLHESEEILDRGWVSGGGVLPRYVHGVMRCTLELDGLLDKRAGGTGESAGDCPFITRFRHEPQLNPSD